MSLSKRSSIHALEDLQNGSSPQICATGSDGDGVSGAAAGCGAVKINEASLAPLSDSMTVENIVGPLSDAVLAVLLGCALNSPVRGWGVSCKVFHADRVCLAVDDDVISVLTR